MSMFRLFHIYKIDYNKFGLKKRISVYEKYYLFKCFAFLTGRDEEDSDFGKFDKFIEYLKKKI